MAELTPLPAHERALTLDVLRGFALCGVILGNMVLYSGAWAAQGKGPTPSTLDHVAEWWMSIFVDSKAQTLLTFLFGFGFAMQLLRAESRGEPVLGLYLRRLAALFVIGALHVALLWWGDVTWGYAISGLGMLAFLRTSNRARVAWGLGFIFVPLLVMRVPGAVQAAMSVFLEPSQFPKITAGMTDVLQRTSRDGLAWEHIRYALVWCTLIYPWYFLWTLGRFLLGYVAGQLRWFERDGADHLPVFRRLVRWGGAVGVITTASTVLRRLDLNPLMSLGIPGRLTLAAVDHLGLLAITLFYVGAVVLLMQRPTWRHRLAVLAPTGRMPLTTYVSQSVFCTFLFYGWGLGLTGSLGAAGRVGIALAVYTVQVAIAHLWLRHFRFGPLEWIWRWAVYLKRPAMRLAPTPG